MLTNGTGGIYKNGKSGKYNQRISNFYMCHLFHLCQSISLEPSIVVMWRKIMKPISIRSKEAIKNYSSNRVRSYRLKEEGVVLNLEKPMSGKDLFKEMEIFRQRLIDRFNAKFKIEITVF